MSINYKLTKWVIKSKKWFRWKPKPKGMNQLQQKVYELFSVYVKDSDSELICSIKTMKRHIRNGELLIMLYSASNGGFIVSVIDESENHNMYDVDIASEYGNDLCHQFDTEMERKLRACEHEKRMLVVKDLDGLMKKKKNASKPKKS
jgi:hypothetical protein